MKNMNTEAQSVVLLVDDDPKNLHLMPEMNGFETCQRLKAQEMTTNIPVIFITGLTETQDKLRAFEAGGVDYITKPFQSEETKY
jgi:CheY-like chemotaxis protein